MMDTILNVGVTAAGVAALEAESGAHFASSSFERLLHGFATTMRGISAGVVEDALLDLQRAARAAVKLAVAVAEAGTITVEEALARVSPEQLQTAQAPVFVEPPAVDDVLAEGLACSPGAVVGVAALTCEAARRRAQAGETVVLVRPTTAPADLPGVLAATAVVTGRGGRASHAAVVARGLDRPAVCGTGPTGIADGDTISVDGDRGLVVRGALPLAPAASDPQIKTFLEWHDAHRG